LFLFYQPWQFKRKRKTFFFRYLWKNIAMLPISYGCFWISLQQKRHFPHSKPYPLPKYHPKANFFTALGHLTALLIFLQPGHIES